MHHAPAVSYPVGRCRFQAWVFSASGLAGALVLALWVTQQGWSWAQQLGLVLYGVACALQFWVWHHAPRGQLHWQDQAWFWTPLDQATQAVSGVRVVLDWQSGMLLHLQGVGQWVWVERTQATPHWMALRRAVWGFS